MKKHSGIRKLISYSCIFIIIPFLVAAGIFRGHDRQYLLISFLIVLAALTACITTFEDRKTDTRKMVLVAVMTAISVLGRDIFAFVPFFKPVSAIVILTAVYFGSEAGFLCGALSALISNFTFGQGPWTPFQMLAWGLIGMFAGFLEKPLKRRRLYLWLYGLFAGIFFSFVMDIWTVLWAEDGSFSLVRYGAALVTAAPITAIYAVSNVIFLAVFVACFGGMLERVQKKYGIP